MPIDRGEVVRRTAKTHPWYIVKSDVQGHRRPVKHAGQVVRFLSKAAAEAHLRELRAWLPGGTVLEVKNSLAKGACKAA